MKRHLDWKIFIGELILYAALVLAYFALVLHFLTGWLKDIFDHDRRAYAVIALLLMIGQAVGLEIISGFLFGLMRRERK